MKQYLLDTNICIFMLKNRFGIREAVIKANPENCFVSEITIAELYYGASKSDQKAKRLKDVDFVAEKFQVLPIYPSLPIFGDIRAELEESGKRIDDFDLLIGATAIRNNLIVVSDNIKHLGRLPNVTIENWVSK
jgi:tRNA(fMet)-specific endonuclease VapC